MSPVSPALIADMTAWRRHLHAHPELALEERETAAFVSARLSEMGIDHVTGVGGHGIVATLSRPGSARRVGLRGDMDALPILEQSGLEFASKTPGKMHACGHDGHTAALLGAARLLRDDPGWSGTVHLIFQPAEEGGRGAKAMIADGFFERFPVDRIFGWHNWPGLDAGVLGLREGGLMASGTHLVIGLTGKPSHAAMPHEGRDPLLAAAHLITALQAIAARRVSPLEAAVVSITQIRASDAFNQIAASVEMHGTLRALSEPVRRLIIEELTRMVEGTALTFGMESRLELLNPAPVTANDAISVRLATQAAEAIGQPFDTDVTPSMAGEDFAHFLQKVPGAMVWIGNGPLTPGAELHSPQYRFNDEILPKAAAWLAEVAKTTLRANL